VISSASNDPREYLGQFLMSHGYLTEPELKKAMEVQQQSRILLGKILVMIDVISEPTCSASCASKPRKRSTTSSCGTTATFTSSTTSCRRWR
jgi:hypothetical protein